MTNEAILIQQLEDRLLEVTIADATAVPKGTVLKLTDPNTAALSAADNDIFLGIASSEKVANDGKTRISVWRHGVFDMKDSGAGITAGDPVMIKGANLIATLDEAGALGSQQIVGMALQTAAANEVIEVLVGAF